MFSCAHEEWPEWDADAPAQRRAQTQAQQIAAIIAPQRRSSAAHLIAQLRGGPLMALRPSCKGSSENRCNLPGHPVRYSARANFRIREPFTRHGLMPWSAHPFCSPKSFFCRWRSPFLIVVLSLVACLLASCMVAQMSDLKPNCCLKVCGRWQFLPEDANSAATRFVCMACPRKRCPACICDCTAVSCICEVCQRTLCSCWSIAGAQDRTSEATMIHRLLAWHVFCR